MRHGKITPYLFILPTIIGVFVFRLGPTAVAAYASFTRWNVRTPPEFLALGNYIELINNETFWLVFRNTLLFTAIFVPGVMIISLLMAMMVNQKLPGIAFFRGLYFLPYITAMVAVAMVWRWIFATRFGVLNYVLTNFFMVADPPAWLADKTWALPSLAIVAIWKQVGFQMLIFLAGLQGIPATLYEAAAIDGASKTKQFFNITLPLLSPITFFIFIITVIDAFKTFEVTFAMTGGGPNNASTTLAFYIYQNAFTFGRMGYASALAMFLMLIVGAATFISFRLKDRLVDYAL
ncbi:MAG: sugar ABC transporter permease [Ardenticatenaceae bacterium]|nr:sugar ABC transporter permease [Ardenticatenaceae bacterium]